MFFLIRFCFQACSSSILVVWHPCSRVGSSAGPSLSQEHFANQDLIISDHKLGSPGPGREPRVLSACCHCLQGYYLGRQKPNASQRSCKISLALSARCSDSEAASPAIAHWLWSWSKNSVAMNAKQDRRGGRQGRQGSSACF